SDVAQKIAAALKAALTPEEKVYIEKKPTDNMEAYDYFLKGKHFWNTKTTQEGNQKAVDLFDKATKLDPDFALAYAWASIVHSTLYSALAWDHTQARKELAKGALDKALALDPDHPMVHFAKGVYQTDCLKDYNSALREYEIAFKGEPNNGEIGEYLGTLYMKLGNWKKAEETLLKAYELNPLGLNIAWRVGSFYKIQRQFDKAEHYYNLAIQSNPEQRHFYRGKAYNYLYGFGDIKKARSLLKNAETIILNPEGLLRAQFRTEIFARDFSKALRYAKEEKKRIPLPRTFRVGRAYYYQGEEKLAQEEFKSLRVYYENKVLEEGPDKALFQDNLGLIYAYLGLKDKAIEEGKKGTDLLPVSKDHIVGTYLVEDLAIIYILTGKLELALDKLEYLLSIPGYLTIWTLRLDPAYDPLRDNPRFQKLINKKD
ncbi:MAG: tetratricopeptide repeat protein, partial [Bacteroidetes bacterium]|nr:tetratricopeptide repeat protein [Bacteroidota bacterium]